jgi:hypothetical protein
MIRGSEEGRRRPRFGSEAAKMIGIIVLVVEQYGNGSESDGGGEMR